MRELTLLETGFLVGGLLLSLVLPLLVSFRGPTDAAIRRHSMKILWIGQGILAVAGLVVLTSASLAPYAAAFGLLSSVICVSLLLRRFQSLSPG